MKYVVFAAGVNAAYVVVNYRKKIWGEKSGRIIYR